MTLVIALKILALTNIPAEIEMKLKAYFAMLKTKYIYEQI